jgi:predicted TIM-barrel fold metal-dependent hydrolase
VIDDIFVFDNVIHVYDFSDENSKLEMRELQPWRDHWRKAVRRTRWEEGPIGQFTPDFEWLRKFSNEEMYDMEFRLSPVDMAMAHAVPVFDWFKNGLSPLEAQHAFVTANPERTMLCGAVDPIHHGIHGAMEEMERQVVELGARSFKFYNGHIDLSWRCDDRDVAYPLYEKAQELGIEVLQFHKGLPFGQWDIDSLRPIDLQRPARDFPDLKFLIHHLAMPYFDEAQSIASRFPNVHLALSGVLSMVKVAPRLVQEQMGKLLQHVGADKLLWGSEAAMTGPPGPFLEQFMKLEIPHDMRDGYGYPQITLEDKRKILGLNMAKLFHVDVDAKIQELGLNPKPNEAGHGAGWSAPRRQPAPAAASH